MCKFFSFIAERDWPAPSSFYLHGRLLVEDPVALRAFDGARLVLVADRVLRRLLDYDMLIPFRVPAKVMSFHHT